MLKAKTMVLYTKYLKLQARMLDLESVGEKFEEIRTWIRGLCYYSFANGKWVKEVEDTVAEVVEYINVATYLCMEISDGRVLILPEVAEALCELCDLKHNVMLREDLDSKEKERLVDLIWDVIAGGGRYVTVQDEKHWFEIAWMFELDPKGELKKKLESDKALLASGVSIEKVTEDFSETKQQNEETAESIALKILKEAIDSKKTHIMMSWVQRRFNYGYGKSMKLIDWLGENGYVETSKQMKDSYKGRKILVDRDDI